MASLIVNGDFDALTPVIVNPGPSSQGGWTFVNNAEVLATGGNPNKAVRLESNGSATTDPTISQTVSGLTVGATYRLEWDLALRSAIRAGSGRSFGVFLDSQTFPKAVYLNEYLVGSFTNPVYTHQFADFVATSTSHTIIFAGELDSRTNGGTGSTDVSYNLDNVALNPIQLLVQNGSFEQPVIAGGFSYLSSVPGWTVLGAEPVLEIDRNGAFGSNSIAADGQQWAELYSRRPVTIYQDIATVAGQKYTLSFDVGSRPSTAPADNLLGLSIGGGPLQNFSPLVPSTNGTINWLTNEVSFIASSPLTRLAFSDQGTPINGQGTLLDNVSVTAAPVPEPASIAIWSLGAIGLTVLSRRRLKSLNV